MTKLKCETFHYIIKHNLISIYMHVQSAIYQWHHAWVWNASDLARGIRSLGYHGPFGSNGAGGTTFCELKNEKIKKEAVINMFDINFFFNFLEVKFLSIKASVRNTMFHVKAYRYDILEHLFLHNKNKCNFQPSQFSRHLPWKRWILSWFFMKTWCGSIMVSSCHIWSVYCCIIFLLLTFLLLTDNGCQDADDGLSMVNWLMDLVEWNPTEASK